MDRRKGIDPSRTLGLLDAWAGIGGIGRLIVTVAIIGGGVWVLSWLAQLIGWFAVITT